MKSRDAKGAFFKEISRRYGTYALEGLPQLHSGILLLIVASCKVSGVYIYCRRLLLLYIIHGISHTGLNAQGSSRVARRMAFSTSRFRNAGPQPRQIGQRERSTTRSINARTRHREPSISTLLTLNEARCVELQSRIEPGSGEGRARILNTNPSLL